MADAFPNVEQEQVNKNIEKRIENILNNIDFDAINERINKRLEHLNLGDTPDAFSEDRSYINALPKTYKDKTLRYIDVFRDHPEIVQDYLTAIKEFGTEKRALEAGSTAELLHPNKLLTKVLKEPAYEKRR